MLRFLVIHSSVKFGVTYGLALVCRLQGMLEKGMQQKVWNVRKQNTLKGSVVSLDIYFPCLRSRLLFIILKHRSYKAEKEQKRFLQWLLKNYLMKIGCVLSFTYRDGFTSWDPVIWKRTLCSAVGHDPTVPGISANSKIEIKCL